MVHKFVSLFLKRKMEREMGKYKTIEQAFQKIKASTVRKFIVELLESFLWFRDFQMLARSSTDS